MNKSPTIAGLICWTSMLSGAASAQDDAVFSHPKSASELAASLLAEPARAIAATKVLRGKFVHTKHLRDIPAPLQASGEFVFLRDAGLHWRTVKPFESVFVLTPESMVQQDEGGAALTMNANEQPAVRAAARIFMALFAVDVNALESEFLMFGMPDVEVGASGWRLGLRPKNAAMGAVFTQAVVIGDSQVREVRLHDAYGDRTVIQLRDTELLVRAPTAQERALLGAQ